MDGPAPVYVFGRVRVDEWGRLRRRTGNADQFQPHIGATEAGQLNVFFFDRSFDAPEPSRTRRP